MERLFKPFQIRWKEVLRHGDTPYLYRWTLILFGYSIRLHHWVGDDVGPHYHNHPFNFISIVLKGSYINEYLVDRYPGVIIKQKKVSAPSIWKANGEVFHRLIIPQEGAWTLLLCSRPYQKWGFWVNNHLWRPLRYFHKYDN